MIVSITRDEDSSLKDGNNTRFTQSSLWARFKSAHGWSALHFSVTLSTGKTIDVSVLIRTIARICSMAYVPMGPDTEGDIGVEDYPLLLKELTLKVREYLPRVTIFIRYDPPIDCMTLEEKARIVGLWGRTVIKSRVDVQPPDTVLLDLAPSEDELLKAMKPKWRYNIKLAQKKGVTVECIRYDGSNKEEVEAALECFYDIFLSTATRDKIAVHQKDYYRDLLLRSTDEAQVSLYIARHEEDILSGIITLMTPREGVYLYGASSNIKRNYMSTYLLQWCAIKDAKAFGSRVYDFYGIPPTDDPHHPMHGLYLFKTGFGGKVVHRVGSFDIVLIPLYWGFSIAERIRAFYYKGVKKALRNILHALDTRGKCTGCGGAARPTTVLEKTTSTLSEDKGSK